MKLERPETPEDSWSESISILSRIGDKWAIFVVVKLESGPLRFTELKRGIRYVSQKVLTTTLRGLERDGFVKRTVTPSIPPRVDYELTTLGRDLLTPLYALSSFAIVRRKEIEAARHRYDRATRLDGLHAGPNEADF